MIDFDVVHKGKPKLSLLQELMNANRAASIGRVLPWKSSQLSHSLCRSLYAALMAFVQLFHAGLLLPALKTSESSAIKSD
jgi:hypothetical protein